MCVAAWNTERAATAHGFPPSTWAKLERVQNEAMRAIAGLMKTCPVEFLRLETNLEPLQMRLEKNDVILWDRYRRLQEEDERNEMLRKDVPARI